MTRPYFASLKLQGPRPAQEDELRIHSERGILSVADGFGGPAPGSRTSRLACDLIEAFLLRGSRDMDATLPFVLRSYISLAGNVLFNALIYANQKILEDNKKRNINERGGASVLTGFLDGDFLALANIGSCRAWLFRGSTGVPLVSPRTYGRLVDPAAALLGSSHGSQYQVPLTALGMYEDLEPEIVECRLMPQDWLILQTDGVRVDNEAQWVSQICQIKQKNLKPEQAANEVFNLVKCEPNSNDNLSIVLGIF